MRLVRGFVLLMGLSLVVGTSVTAAAQKPSASANREVSGVALFLAQVENFFKSIWENEAGCIDPWGRCSPDGGTPLQAEPGTPNTDGGCHIDPLGSGCVSGQ